MLRLINIGFGNMVAADRIIAIVSPDSAPTKRLIQEARESRRIMGEYVLNVDDLRMGRRFEDVIVHKANFTVDIHNPDGGGQAEGLAEVVKAYDIPYRCLVPLNVENLLVTGRCISATHEAMASFRIMSVCMALGEAAGIAAAIAAAQDVTPRTLDVKLVQNALTAKGADLFG